MCNETEIDTKDLQNTNEEWGERSQAKGMGLSETNYYICKIDKQWDTLYTIGKYNYLW